MAYDVVVESRKLLTEGVPEVPFRLSRRRRFIPAAFDVDGDVAATLFVRRGVSGNPSLESWTFERRGGDWMSLGGGAGDGYDEVFEPRESIDSLFVRYGSGWSARDTDWPLPLRRCGVSHAEMRLAPQVAALRVQGREIAVAHHGLAIVVWATRRPPTATAIAADGAPIGDVPLRARL